MSRYSVSLIIVVLFSLSCGKSTGPNDQHLFPPPAEGVATNITLEVHSNGWGIILDSLELAAEGDIVIDIPEDNPFTDPPLYYIYATASNYYTEIYTCQKGDTITVDLDSIPQVANSITGTIFDQPPFFAGCYLINHQIHLTNRGVSYVASTDDQGRFGFSSLSYGNYMLDFSRDSVPYNFTLTNSNATDYYDLTYSNPYIVYAPNIYLYPVTKSIIDVSIDFPNGGSIINSNPPYNDGWHVSVTPEGIIENMYPYLFYETSLTQPLNTTNGWLLDGSRLIVELRSLMARYGFVGREIDDFIDYWLPKFEGTQWLAVYPQDVESLISLDVSPQPDNLLRVLFLFRPQEKPVPITLPAYSPEDFIRDGYTVVEWGGIL